MITWLLLISSDLFTESFAFCSDFTRQGILEPANLGNRRVEEEHLQSIYQAKLLHPHLVAATNLSALLGFGKVCSFRICTATVILQFKKFIEIDAFFRDVNRYHDRGPLCATYTPTRGEAATFSMS